MPFFPSLMGSHIKLTQFAGIKSDYNCQDPFSPISSIITTEKITSFMLLAHNITIDIFVQPFTPSVLPVTSLHFRALHLFQYSHSLMRIQQLSV